MTPVMLLVMLALLLFLLCRARVLLAMNPVMLLQVMTLLALPLAILLILQVLHMPSLPVMRLTASPSSQWSPCSEIQLPLGILCM